MVSKNQIKLINNLNQKKYRNAQNLFIVEGKKGIQEFLESDLELHTLFCTTDFKVQKENSKIEIITEAELKKISLLKTPNQALAIFYKPKPKPVLESGLTLVLDQINDPGNLGTIIRLCDWFKVTQLICSEDSVDCFNPKVVQATMGSLTRVSIIYTDILSFLKHIKTPIYATAMDGDNVYKSTLPKNAVLIMGNEANGISKIVFKQASHQLAIPRFNTTNKPESLNVASATAILLSEFNR